MRTAIVSATLWLARWAAESRAWLWVAGWWQARTRQRAQRAQAEASARRRRQELESDIAGDPDLAARARNAGLTRERRK
jgi:hypothetical protein